MGGWDFKNLSLKTELRKQRNLIMIDENGQMRFWREISREIRQ